MAGAGIPFPSRYGLEWRLVLVDPRLLMAAERRLSATGPSHAIEEALKLAVAGAAEGEEQGLGERLIH